MTLVAGGFPLTEGDHGARAARPHGLIELVGSVDWLFWGRRSRSLGRGRRSHGRGREWLRRRRPQSEPPARKELPSGALGASGTRRLAGLSDHHREHRPRERLPRSLLLYGPNRRGDDLLGPRERSRDRELELSSVRASRAQSGWNPGQLARDGNQRVVGHGGDPRGP